MVTREEGRIILIQVGSASLDEKLPLGIQETLTELPRPGRTCLDTV